MPADEFDIIRSLFAPLATHAGARGLIDDVALIGGLVVTTDAIVEGVHFRSDDPIETIAKKALRVNLSDLAAKGVCAKGVMLTLIWPDHRPAAQIRDFANGLAEDLALYDLALLGGDTTSTPGPLTVSITAFGEPLGARTPSRSDARVGDDVWVTGTIGDAWLGFEALRGAWPAGEANQRDAAITRYRLPEPRVGFAPMVSRFANGSMDVSDGLLGDAAKLAAASGVALQLQAAAIPISAAARTWMAHEGAHAHGRLLDWGDDYEILFTAAAADRAEIKAFATGSGVLVTRIGAVEAGAGLFVDGALYAATGHAHRLGR
jgi:thiamine-monophosphate kinase